MRYLQRPHRYGGALIRCLAAAAVLVLVVVLAFEVTAMPAALAQVPAYSLRFYGNGQGDIDRVKFRLDGPSRPIDVGADFTIEFWLKALPGENSATRCDAGESGWIYGNIILDRDVYGPGDYGDYGISLYSGRIAFGVSRGSQGATLCGNRPVDDGNWHHIAVTRQSSSGAMAIFVDGQLDVQGTGPTGDISYRNGRRTSYPNSDPFLVLGAEKHDAGPDYPSFSGWIDDLRISRIVRYNSDFTPLAMPFVQDSATVALYHFDEGPVGPCTGSIRDFSRFGVSEGICRYGGSPAGPEYSTDTPFSALARDQEWHQFAHDAQRTGYVSASVPPPWRLKWIWNGSNSRGGIAPGKFRLPRNSQPVTGNGRVYVAAGTRGVYALDNATGKVLWRRSFSGAVVSTPAYDGQTDTLYVLSTRGRLYRVSARNGRVLGQYVTGSSSNLPLPPLLVGDRVYFSMGNSLFGLDKATLTLAWRYSTGALVQTPPAYSAARDLLVVVTEDLYVHAVRAADGSQVWRVKPTPRQPGTPQRDDDLAAAGNGWPVVADQHGLVFVRYRLDWNTLWSAPPVTSNAEIRQFLQDNPSEQPLFALRLGDGEQGFIPNVLNGGFGDGGYLPMGPMPVVKVFDDNTEVAYVVMRSRPCDLNPESCDGRGDSHLAEMVLDETTSPPFRAGEVRMMRNTPLPTDEQPYLSMAGNYIFAGHFEVGVAHEIVDRSNGRGTWNNRILTADLSHVVVSQDEDVCGSGFSPRHYCGSGLFNTRPWPGGFYIYWRKGKVYDRYWSEYATWVVSRDTIYFVSTDGAIVALEHGDPQ